MQCIGGREFLNSYGRLLISITLIKLLLILISNKYAIELKYTDYAIGKFLELAKTHPWFENTIFVITADHCASSAGKTDLPAK